MSATAGNPCEESPFSRIIDIEHISPKGITDLLEANAKERAAITKVLDLLSLDSLRMKYKLHRTGANRFKLQGRLLAEATQSCVVTLEAVASKIDEEIDIEFWPPEEVAHLEREAEKEGMEVPLDGPEPLLEGYIDVGHLAYEHFAAALDPYPRQPGASFEWQDPNASGAAEGSNKPFAELARLKNRKDAGQD